MLCEINEFNESNFHFPIPSEEETYIPRAVAVASCTTYNYTSLTEEVGCERRVHLLSLDGAAGVAVLAVLLARRRRLPDDPLHLLELLRVHVTVAVQVEHPERDLELPPDEVDESDVRIL